ncbi:NAD-dependent epimerase/dehydratase family protein [Chitinimonas naiadis]
MRILITGATGYLGTHLSLALSKAGHTVIGLDNFSASDRAVLPALRQLAGPAFQFVEGDLKDTACLRSLFLRYQPQSVVHLAAAHAGPDGAPVPVIEDNISSLLSLLGVMERYEVKRLLSCSSACIYGQPAKVPVDEQTPPAPQDGFARSKVFCEQILNDLCRANPDWHVIQFRPFNIVGSHVSGRLPMGARPEYGLFPALIRAAQDDKAPLSIEGDDHASYDGTALRDYLHINDFSAACLAALPLLATRQNITVNIGTGRGHSVYEVLRAFARTSQRAIPFRITAARPTGPSALYGSCELAQQLLNWRAQMSLADICGDSWRTAAPARPLQAGSHPNRHASQPR